METKIVQPQVTRDPLRFRGHNSSEEANRFQDAVVYDVHNLSTAVNTLNSKIISLSGERDSEVSFLKRRLADLEERFAYREHTFGKAGIKIDKYIDFHNTKGFYISPSLSALKTASFKSQFGEVYLPATAIENKFYNLSLRTTEIVLPPDLLVDTTSQFDKGEGDGIQDYENGGIASETSPLNAFNGINEKAWIRHVTFPLESDVDQVEVQLDAVVPAGASEHANLIEIVPFPEGSCDITLLATSPSIGSSFVSVDNFEETNNATATRYHFTPRSVDQIRVRMRCRNWRELNGKKVFIYGLQELGAKHINYVKEYSTDDNFGDNVTHIVKIDAPRDHIFTKLFRIDPYPNFFNEDLQYRHIRLRLSTTPDYNNVFWDSATNIAPQLGVVAGITMGGSSTIYAIYTLKYVDSISTGAIQVFSTGTTSYQKGLGLVFSATPTNANR